MLKVGTAEFFRFASKNGGGGFEQKVRSGCLIHENKYTVHYFTMDFSDF